MKRRDPFEQCLQVWRYKSWSRQPPEDEGFHMSGSPQHPTFLAFILPQQSIDITASHHPLNVRASIPLIDSGQWLKTQLLVCQVFENVLVNMEPFTYYVSTFGVSGHHWWCCKRLISICPNPWYIYIDDVICE